MRPKPTPTGKSHSSFGTVMSERTWSAESGYRYGFNGKEGDDEFSVDEGSYDFGARLYDSRLGRWWSVENLFKIYSDQSVYSYVNNGSISHFDSDGNKIVVHYHENGKPRRVVLKEVNDLYVAYNNEFVNSVVGILRQAHELGLQDVTEVLNKRKAVHVYYNRNKAEYARDADYPGSKGRNQYHILFDPAESSFSLDRSSSSSLRRAKELLEEKYPPVVDPETRMEQPNPVLEEELNAVRRACTGSYIYPDEAFIHEIGHWLDEVENGTASFRNDANTNNEYFDNQNEVDVMGSQGIEGRYLTLKGRALRESHHAVDNLRKVDKDLRARIELDEPSE